MRFNFSKTESTEDYAADIHGGSGDDAGRRPSLDAREAATASWDLSTVWPEGNFHTKNAMAFADAVGKATEGAIKITVQQAARSATRGLSICVPCAMDWCRWPTS